MSNIEPLISEVSYKIVSKILENKENKTKLKNLIDKSLGVLSSNGVYAYYVYIKSQGVESIFLEELKDIFNLVKVNDINYSSSNREEYFQNISKDLHRLIFLKQLLEKTLIYARYHAKALG